MPYELFSLMARLMNIKDHTLHMYYIRNLMIQAYPSFMMRLFDYNLLAMLPILASMLVVTLTNEDLIPNDVMIHVYMHICCSYHVFQLCNLSTTTYQELLIL